MNRHHKMNYVEFPGRDPALTKSFFEAAFAWRFEDYGPDDTAFSNEGLDGGVFRSDQLSSAANGAALTVFYSEDLESTQQVIERAGGKVIKEIFGFPGGRRFHFTEPGGNEFAVWPDHGERSKG
ncbi:VOC family protein [Kiritimatiellaeota bacterium B1221]|nr:VOC family protein [Kiritimatiellaeota bacterium B1221]